MITHRSTLDVPEDLASWIENVIAARRSERGGIAAPADLRDQIRTLTRATATHLRRFPADHRRALEGGMGSVSAVPTTPPSIQARKNVASCIEKVRGVSKRKYRM